MVKNSKDLHELNSDTPEWFKEWHNKEFWHFKVKVELYNKLTLIMVAALISAAVARLIF